MKPVRLVLVAGATFLLFLTGFAALLSNSTVQTWEARRFLATRPELRASVGSVSVVPGRVRATDVTLESHGAVCFFPEIEAGISLWSAVWDHELRVSRLAARGCTLDFSGLRLSPMETAFKNGVSSDPKVMLLAVASTLPRHIPGSIAGFRISGVPGGGAVDLQGEVILPASSSTGRTGFGILGFRLAGTPTTVGDAYAAEFDIAGRPFASVRGHYVDSVRRFKGRWKLDLSAGDGAPIATKGEGSIESSEAEVHVEGRLQTSAARLAGFLPAPAPPGAIQVSAEFDAVRRGSVWRIKGLKASLEGARPILEFDALQEFEFNPGTREVRMTNPARDLARLSLLGVPLDWAGPWLYPTILAGTDLRGELLATPGGRGVLLRTQSPLLIDHLSGVRNGRRLFNDLSVSMDAAFEIRPEGWQVAMAPLTVRSGSGRVFSMEAKLGRLAGPGQPMKIAGRFDADLPEVLGQAAAGHRIELRRGDMTCDFEASLGSERSIDAKVAISDLDSVLVPGGLPGVVAEVRADIGPEGRLAFNAPLHLERQGRESDVTLSGTVLQKGAGLVMDIQASGGRVDADDIRAIVGTFSGAGPRMAQPFWRGVDGRLVFALERATLEGDPVAENISGSVDFAPRILKLAGLRARIDGGEAAMAGEIRFDPVSPYHYVYQSDIRINGLDAAPFFLALAPGRPPTFQGKFDMAGHFEGSSPDLREIPPPAAGELLLTSKGGIFRALSRGIEMKTDPAGKIAVIGAFIGNMADTVTFRKDAREQDRKAHAVADFSGVMKALPYDRIDVVLSRDTSLNIDVREFSLISPEVRLEGAGQVTALHGAPFLAQPLDVELRLSARGRTAEMLRTAGLLTEKKDELGYTACALPMELLGSLLEPDAGAFREALLKAAHNPPTLQ